MGLQAALLIYLTTIGVFEVADLESDLKFEVRLMHMPQMMDRLPNRPYLRFRDMDKHCIEVFWNAKSDSDLTFEVRLKHVLQTVKPIQCIKNCRFCYFNVVHGGFWGAVC